MTFEEHDLASDEEVLFQERRPLRPHAWVLLAVPVVMLVTLVLNLDEAADPLLSAVVGLAAVIGFAVLGWATMLSPVGTELRHLRVTWEGLWVRDRLLPAAEIGWVEALDDAGMQAAGWGWWRGVRIGWGQSSAALGAMGPAVFVFQDRVGVKRPGWAVCTRRPEELAAVLERVRDAARAGDTARAGHAASPRVGDAARSLHGFPHGSPSRARTNMGGTAPGTAADVPPAVDVPRAVDVPPAVDAPPAHSRRARAWHVLAPVVVGVLMLLLVLTRVAG